MFAEPVPLAPMAATDQRLPITGGEAKRAYVRGAFAGIAASYDRLNHLLSLNADRRWRRAAIDALDWRRRPAGRYLDLCAGTLDLAAELARRRGFSGQVVAADFVPEMLRCGAGKADRIAAAAADVLQLPFGGAIFDGAMVGFGVRNLMDLDAGLRETARVLAPGAPFVVLEFTTPRWPPFRSVYLCVLPPGASAHRPHGVETYERLRLATSIGARVSRSRRAGAAPRNRWIRGRLLAVALGRHRRDSPRHAKGIMSLDSLPAFLAAIASGDELVRIGEPVRTHLEIAEIADRVMKRPGGGPALLFEHPQLPDGTTSPIPVAINLFGSERRMALALGVDRLDAIGERLGDMLNLKVPEGLLAKLAMLPRLAELASFPPRVRSGRAPCQAVVQRGDEIDLDRLPLLQTWPGDGGRYLTLPMVITRDPERGTRNVGMYRVQQLGQRDLAMHWQRHKTGAAHWREMAARGETMPVVIALGGDPASIYAASAPLPPGIDEFLFAGFLRRDHVDLVTAVTCDLQVPAEAEIVIEGYIDPAEPLVMEGPFGDHTGFYSLADEYPRMHVTAVTMKERPIYAATLVGRPPMEDYWLGHATERIFLPLLKLTVPEIVDYHMPAAGIFHNLVFVSIDKQYPGQAYKVMHALWGQGLMSLAKVLIVVDKDVNVHDMDEVLWVALNHIDPQRDLEVVRGPVDVLDHAAQQFTFGGKLGIDGTRKWPEEGFTRAWPDRIVMDAATKRRIDDLWPRLGIDS